ncbi:MAG TPA: RNase adapter RapZ [Candidatus Binatia bacterium]|nr:RNase adapter RapZ [Candidatus Binatia bacterium]
MSPAEGPRRSVDVLVVTGMSGSGRSTAIHALEDLGAYCIDNLPTALVFQFVALCSEARAGKAKVGLGLDVRDAAYVKSWPSVRQELERAGHRVTVVYLDASDEVLLRRYSETRRVHPLGGEGDVPEAIRAERELLAPLERAADLVVDTSHLTVHDLKRRLQEFAEGTASYRGPAVTIKSFGFKYGSLPDADMLLDVRFLPNPHFVDELRPLTGRDAKVASYVLEPAVAGQYLDHVMNLLEFVLPHYAVEGRPYMTIGLGCTGGRHRSVCIAEEIGRRLRQRGVEVNVRHRDADRP